MKCITCQNDAPSTGQKKCKPCYDKARYYKISNGAWKFNSKPPTSLTETQLQVLIGGLLGDTSLYQYKNQINSGISIKRSIIDLEYLEYQFYLYKDFCMSGIKVTNTLDARTNKIYKSCSFRTQVSPVISSIKNKWYINATKIIPLELRLTPLICAIWFCDDGSVVRCGSSKKGLRISLYTDSFLKKEVEFLQSLLHQAIDIQFKIARKNSMKDLDKGFYLYISKKSEVLKYIEYIKDYMPKQMSRKSIRWKDYINALV
jgi:hypothetical protein